MPPGSTCPLSIPFAALLDSPLGTRGPVQRYLQLCLLLINAAVARAALHCKTRLLGPPGLLFSQRVVQRQHLAAANGSWCYFRVSGNSPARPPQPPSSLRWHGFYFTWRPFSGFALCMRRTTCPLLFPVCLPHLPLPFQFRACCRASQLHQLCTSPHYIPIHRFCPPPVRRALPPPVPRVVSES